MDTAVFYKIKNSKGMELEVSNYGATICSLKVSNKYGLQTNVVVGLEEIEDYLQSPYTEANLYLGSSIGRYAGRISSGGFTIGNKSYYLKNTNGVHLHGGLGFDKKLWTLKSKELNAVHLTYTSPHLEDGYPGDLVVEALFELNDDNCLTITYSATTTEATPVNLTCHPYINLNGFGTVLDHELWINSTKHMEVDDKLLPTGAILNSENTAFDYSIATKVNKSNFQGLDDTFVMDEGNLKARITGSKSGITMSIFHKQPAMVVYTPKLFPELKFKNNLGTGPFAAICFEPQNFPDAPNQSTFPNSILYPNEVYKNEIVFQFVVK